MPEALIEQVTAEDEAHELLQRVVRTMPASHKAGLVQALRGVADRNRHDLFRRGFFLAMIAVVEASESGASDG